MKTRSDMDTEAEILQEGSKFKPLNFPDPFSYGDKYRPVFPPRHHTVKAVLNNIPETISKVYIFGSAIRLDCAVNSDVDIFLIGSLSNHELNKIIRAVPEGERADILVETESEFLANLQSGCSQLYKKVYEGGYKIYVLVSLSDK